jgi:hypothetical protein
MKACFFIITGLLLTNLTMAAENNCESQNVEEAVLSLLHTPQEPWHGFLDRDSGKPATADFLRSAMTIKDIKNGYLKIEHDDLTSTYEAALFKASDRRSHYLLINNEGASVTNLSVQKCSDGRWVKDEKAHQIFSPAAGSLYRKAKLIGLPIVDGERLTEDIVETFAGSPFTYRLPRQGREVKILANYDAPQIYHKYLASIVFDGMGFRLK